MHSFPVFVLISSFFFKLCCGASLPLLWGTASHRGETPKWRHSFLPSSTAGDDGEARSPVLVGLFHSTGDYLVTGHGVVFACVPLWGWGWGNPNEVFLCFFWAVFSRGHVAPVCPPNGPLPTPAFCSTPPPHKHGQRSQCRSFWAQTHGSH